MSRRSISSRVLILAAMVWVVPVMTTGRSPAVDIVVDTTADAVDFTGAQQVADLPGPDGRVSLREAVIAANNSAGPQVIGFNIPLADPGFAGGVFTITPLSPNMVMLIDSGTTIDGASQTTATGDTNALGPEIVLDGHLAGPGPGILFQPFSEDNTIRGLVIHGFAQAGIQFITGGGGSPNRNTVRGCYIGTDPIGSTAIANGWEGIAINGVGNVIGGENPGDGNLVAGNHGAEIVISGPSSPAGVDTVVQGNRIGTDRTGTTALGTNPNVTGLWLSSAFNSRIENNVIAFNTGAGVWVESGAGNAIRGNRIFSNGGLGIDLGGPGVNPNDAGDGDSGANGLQNYPLLTLAFSAPGQLIIEGTIDTANPQDVVIEFFENAVPVPGGDPSGHGEGARFLGAVRPNRQGRIHATVRPVAPGTLITATATDAAGNTSEFAVNIAARFQ